MEPDDRRSVRDTWLGLGLTFLLHLLQVPMAMIRAAFFIPLWIIGLSQLLYIVPAILIARGRGRPGIVRGLIIGASLTFLLNAACFGFIFGAPLLGRLRLGR